MPVTTTRRRESAALGHCAPAVTRLPPAASTKRASVSTEVKMDLSISAPDHDTVFLLETDDEFEHIDRVS
jgi:hypothetical protein